MVETLNPSTLLDEHHSEPIREDRGDDSPLEENTTAVPDEVEIVCLEEEDATKNHEVNQSVRSDNYCHQIRLIPEINSEPTENPAPWQPIDRAGINQVLKYERQEGRTPHKKAHNHPGYDIESQDSRGNIRYIEVKSLKGKWSSYDISMTHTQFEIARQLGNNYWLYIVEQAEDEREFKIYPIQNPGGKKYRISYHSDWKQFSE